MFNVAIDNDGWGPPSVRLPVVPKLVFWGFPEGSCSPTVDLFSVDTPLLVIGWKGSLEDGCLYFLCLDTPIIHRSS